MHKNSIVGQESVTRIRLSKIQQSIVRVLLLPQIILIYTRMSYLMSLNPLHPILCIESLGPTIKFTFETKDLKISLLKANKILVYRL